MTAPEPPAMPRPGPQPVSPAPAAAHRSTVATAVARLDGVHEVPLHEQPDLFQAVHTELQNALAAIDDA